MRPPVKDKQSIDNDSVNDKNQALSTVVSKIQNDGNTQRNSVEKNVNQNFKIPVRYGGVTEDIETTDDSFFKGVKRRRTARYYLSGIDSKSTRAAMVSYLESQSVRVTYLRLFKSKHNSRIVSAKLNVDENSADVVEARDFWPEGVNCRRWLSNFEWNQRITDETEDDDKEY